MGVAREWLAMDPFDVSLFVVVRRRRDRMSLLLWDDSGSWLPHKRLVSGAYMRLRSNNSQWLSLSRAEVAMLLNRDAIA